MCAGLPGLAALVAVLLYLPALGYGFVFDDLSLIGAAGPAPLGGEVLPYRPLRYLSLRLDFALGGGRTWVYHATNVALHAAGCALVVHAASRLGAYAVFALLAGVTIAIHPLCVEAVAYVSGRRDLLAGVLGLGAVLAWMSDSGRTGLAVILLLAAVAAKESALIFWAVLVGASTFGFGPRLRYAMPTLGWVLPAALALPVAYGAIGPTLGRAAPADELLIAGRTAAHYLSVLVWPVRLSIEYPMLVCSEDCSQLAGPAALSGLSVLGALCAATGGLGLRAAAKGGPMPVGFALSWATVVLVALALLIGRHEPGADRHAFPLVAAAAVLAALAAGRLGERARAVAAAAWLAVLALLCAVTVQRMPVWESSRALWQATVATTPESTRARYNLAAVLAADGERVAARRQLRRALRIRPDYGPAHAGLAWIGCRDGHPVKARRHIEMAHEHGAPFDMILAAERECRARDDGTGSR